jgi:hypothetical protein
MPTLRSMTTGDPPHDTATFGRLGHHDAAGSPYAFAANKSSYVTLYGNLSHYIGGSCYMSLTSTLLIPIHT